VRKRWTLALVLTSSLFLTTGCWDRVELNDRAIAVATGLDLAEDGSLILSSQFALPAQIGGPGNSSGGKNAFQFFESKGKDIQDAKQNIQARLSRQVFLGHRRAIIIGEPLARHGVRKVLDELSRNPGVRLRTDIFIIQGGEAREFLQMSYPFERIPAIATLRIHKEIGGYPGDTAFRDFLIDATSDGTSPSLLSMIGDRVSGRAVFDRDLKLIGFLKMNEAANRLWLTGSIKHFIYTFYAPEGKGYVSLKVSNFKRKIVSKIRGQEVFYDVSLSGKADIIENEGSLDLSKREDIKMVEDAFNKEQEKEVYHLINRVQVDYKTDIFRFGQIFHRQHPRQWKVLKKDWDTLFVKAKVSVKVHVKVQSVGMTGRPLQFAEPSKGRESSTK